MTTETIETPQTTSDLQAARLKLVNEKIQLEFEISELGITKNAINFKAHEIKPELLALRKKLTSRLKEVVKDLQYYKSELTAREQSKDGNSYNCLKSVLRDCLSGEKYEDVINEMLRRERGGTPMKIVIEHQKPQYNASAEIKKKCIELVEKLETARTALNKYIRINEPEINKAEFFNEISELNRALPALSDIQKIKRLL